MEQGGGPGPEPAGKASIMGTHHGTTTIPAPRPGGHGASATGEPTTSHRLDRLWSKWPASVAVAVVIAATAGWLSAWWTPRGPLTTSQALISMVAAVCVGVGTGTVLANRWSLLVIPGVYMIVFEAARIGTTGATVDAISLSTLGVYALVVGRLAHGLIVLTPLVLGAGYGLMLSRRLGNHRAPRPGIPAWTVTSLLTIAVIVLAVLIARPAWTAPIVGPDGEVVPGSIAEFVRVEIGGVDQVMMIRGRSIDSPVLLHLAGGPGGTDIGAMRADTGLEQDFVVVTWDQRGTGKSYATSLDPVESLTVDQAVADTIEVTEYLRDRFGEDKIYLTANSWGSIPSVHAVQQRPELFHAYIGSGQMVNNRATDRMFYEDALAWAEQTGDDGLAARMRDAGPPPYEDLLDYQYTTMFEHDWNAYPGVGDLWEMPFNLLVPENTLMERINGTRALFDVNWFVYPQLQDYDFRRDATHLEVPVYLVRGRYEARGRDVLVQEWFDVLEAPAKEMVVFEHSGHRPTFEEPDVFVDLMREVVAATGGRA